MSNSQPRQSKGTPAGGQWRAAERPEGNVHLSGPPSAGDEPDGRISTTAPAPKVVRTGESRGITRYDVFVGGEKVGQVIKVAGHDPMTRTGRVSQAYREAKAILAAGSRNRTKPEDLVRTD